MDRSTSTMGMISFEEDWCKTKTVKYQSDGDIMFGIMDNYVLWCQILVLGTPLLLIILSVAFGVIWHLTSKKHKKIMDEVFGAKRGDEKGNHKLGFYPPEEEGSFGKESFKTTFEDEGDMDIHSFMLTDTEKSQFPREQVVEHVALDTRIRDFNAPPGNMAGYQQQGAMGMSQQSPQAQSQMPQQVPMQAQPPMGQQPGMQPQRPMPQQPGMQSQPPMPQQQPMQAQPQQFQQTPMQGNPQMPQQQVVVNVNVPQGGQGQPPQQPPRY